MNSQRIFLASQKAYVVGWRFVFLKVLFRGALKGKPGTRALPFIDIPKSPGPKRRSQKTAAKPSGLGKKQISAQLMIEDLKFSAPTPRRSEVWAPLGKWVVTRKMRWPGVNSNFLVKVPAFATDPQRRTRNVGGLVLQRVTVGRGSLAEFHRRFNSVAQCPWKKKNWNQFILLGLGPNF